MKDYKRKIILTFGAVMVFNCAAHDTNTSHPRITEAIFKSLKSQDESITNYFQLYQTHPDYVTKLVGDAHYAVELDQPYPYLWGYDPQFDDADEKEIDEDQASPNYPAFRKKSLNVLDGVVMEDSPTNRVMSHFQHAYTGAPMSVDDWLNGANWLVDSRYGRIEPSEITAGRFFNDAIHTMGYLNTIDDLNEMVGDGNGRRSLEKQGRKLSGAKAMWLFGHALHHAEDMSSIAHIHGDAHLTLAKDSLSEPDDYEAHFIPSKIYEFIKGLDKDYWFEPVSLSKTINNAGQIWGRKTDPATYALLENYLDPANMSRGIYNTALFQADLAIDFSYAPLDFSYSDPLLVERDGKYWRYDEKATQASYKAAGKLCGGGELSKMFYFGDLSDFDRSEGPNFNACGLRVNIDSRALPEYEIMHAAAKVFGDSGNFEAHGFHYDGRFNSFYSDWWEASVFGGPEGYYYIEETMKGVVYEGKAFFRDIAAGEMLLRPHYIRQDITKPHSANNPLIKTCTDWSVSALRCYKGDSLLERFAEKLIPYSLEFLVGYSQFFYDVANLPPYLQQVEVIQDERKRYGMKWQGKINYTGRIEMTHEEGNGEHTIEDFAYIAQRYKAQTIPNLSFITQDKAISINLKFNEAIRAPDAQNSEFSLGLALNEQQAFFDSRNLESAILADSSFKGCFTVGSSENLTSNCWQIKVPSAALKSLFSGDLNGRVTLLVQAADMNNHRDLNGKPSDNLNHGALLDATPTTPARRYVKRSGAEYTIFDDGKARYSSQENLYYWHSDTSKPGNMFGTYANKQGAFAYDPGYDKNHILLFDSRKPEIRLEVTTGIALPEDKKE
ncbi:hypothetical protein QL989_17720 [Pseudoalteromonas sp. APC 3224]|uniref:hypothetical protein n=1 Tax=Pseudoalteromonas sp. APC 3224 TaxID=3035203 RepID=UPI0025B32471|nr:hypothetical protein [Pseudoalteromonas sp. APC 3224]MDN3487180.1 hypothetical protein [Pseudoalteromonas sp. APC 3224]